MLIDFFDSTVPPRFVHFPGQTQHLVLLLDGSGSWGNGVEAAAFGLREMSRRRTGATAWTLSSVIDEFETVLSQTPPGFREDSMGWSYAFVALLIAGSELSCAIAGNYQTSLVRNGSSIPLFKPRMLKDHLASLGQLSAEQRSSTDYASVCMELFAGHNDKPNLTVVRETIRPGDSVRIAKPSYMPAAFFDARYVSAKSAAATAVRPDPGVVGVINL